jgi:hypothetical protein
VLRVDWRLSSKDLIIDRSTNSSFETRQPTVHKMTRLSPSVMESHRSQSQGPK